MVYNIIRFMLEKILVSSCLLGKPVRYNGTGATSIHPILQKWLDENRLIAACPEILAGLSIPRLPAEIKGENAGIGVLNQTAKVIEKNGKEVTKIYVAGAEKALALIKKHNIKMAILKARSPSCGILQTYDGSFSNKLIVGSGVTGALLQQHSCRVFNEEHLEDAKKYFDNI